MTLFFTIILVLASLGLIISVLMQSGKSAGLSGAIGGGAEQLFGKQKGRGYDKLFDRATKVSAILFILSALILVAIQ
jgi:preprotein translocase subunit SecG